MPARCAKKSPRNNGNGSIASITRFILPQAEGQFSANPNDFLSSILDGIHLFKGVSDTTMIHGQGWQFIRLG